MRGKFPASVIPAEAGIPCLHGITQLHKIPVEMSHAPHFNAGMTEMHND